MIDFIEIDRSRLLEELLLLRLAEGLKVSKNMPLSALFVEVLNIRHFL